MNSKNIETIIVFLTIMATLTSLIPIAVATPFRLIIGQVMAGILAMIAGTLAFSNRKKFEGFRKYLFIIGGVFAGLTLNDGLSTWMFKDWVIVTPGVIMELIGTTLLFLSYGKFSKWYVKFSEYVVLGISVISVIKAFSAFVQVLFAWLPHSTSSGVDMELVQYNLEIIVNIVKSLFISSVFVLLDKLAKLLRKDQRT